MPIGRALKKVYITFSKPFFDIFRYNKKIFFFSIFDIIFLKKHEFNNVF